MDVNKDRYSTVKRSLRFVCSGILIGGAVFMYPESAADPETLDEFKKAYPPFNIVEARIEAEALYPIKLAGDSVYISTVKGVFNGKYGGISNGYVLVNGSKVCQLTDLSAKERAQFDKGQCDELRQIYIQKKFMEYVEAKNKAIAGFNTAEVKTGVKESSSAGTVNQSSESQKISALGVLLSRQRHLESGTVVELVSVSGDYVEFKADKLRMSMAAKDIVVYRGLDTSSSSFDISQAVLGILADSSSNEVDSLISLLEYRKDDDTERSSGIIRFLASISDTKKDLSQCLSEASKVCKEKKELEKKYWNSKNSANDPVFGRISGNKSSEYASGVNLCEEKLKSLLRRSDSLLIELHPRIKESLEKLSARGDYVAACILLDYYSSIQASLNQMTVRESPFAPANNSSFSRSEDSYRYRQMQELITSSYRQAANNRERDRGSDLLSRYRAVYGLQEEKRARWSDSSYSRRTAEEYEKLDESAKESIKNYADLKENLESGDLKRLVESYSLIVKLMPRTQDMKKLESVINERIDKVISKVKDINQMETDGRYDEFIKGVEALNPAPSQLQERKEELLKSIEISRAKLKKAQQYLESGDLDLILNCVKDSKAAWPKNPELLAFVDKFANSNSALLSIQQNIDAYTSQNMYEAAVTECEKLDEICKAFKPRLLDSIKKKKESYTAKLSMADNYYKAARYDEALRIYEEIDCKDGIKKICINLLEMAKQRQDWAKAIALLERLERWEEAGDLRRSKNIQDIDIGVTGGNYDGTAIFKRSKDAVFVIKTDFGSGSGFAVSRDGYIITNRHVISYSNDARDVSHSVEVSHREWGNTGVKARIIKISPKLDLALLKVDKPLSKILTFEKTPVEEGLKVFAIGNPGNGGGEILDLTITEGHVSKASVIVDGNPCIQSDAAISPGNSGGPLISSSGRVVGVTTFHMLRMNNTFMAIRSEEVRKEFSGIPGLVL